jgi:hypothetical protein
MTTVFTLNDLVKYIIFIGIIYGLMIIIPSQEISKINLILIVSIIYIGFILLDCLNNNSESFSDTDDNTLGQESPTNNVTAVTAIAGNGQATVTWTVPTYNSGSDISSHVISSYIIINNVNRNIATMVDASSFLTTTANGLTTITPTSTATATTVNGLTTITATVLGLINGTPYTFNVLPKRNNEDFSVSLVTRASTSNSVTPTNNIMLYVKIVGGIIAGIFLLYLVIMLFSNNNPDKEEVQEEVEEEN